MAIDLPDGRRHSNEVLDALRSRAIHARELGYSVGDIVSPVQNFLQLPKETGGGTPW